MIQRKAAISVGLPSEKRLGRQVWDLDNASRSKAEAGRAAATLRRLGDFRARVVPVMVKGQRWYGVYVRLSFRRGLSDA